VLITHTCIWFRFRSTLPQQPLLSYPTTLVWKPAGFEECRSAHLAGQDYLYLEQPVGFGRIATHRDFGSQVFRRAIAATLGVPTEYNWRENPQLPKIQATIRRVEAWIADNHATSGAAA
jgi:hypothetical protein